MTGFFIGLAIGIVATAVVLLLLDLARSQGLISKGRREPQGYRKVMIATVDHPFDPRALTLASKMAAGGGILETVYLIEIPLNRPLESESGDEIASGMQALEEAAMLAARDGLRPLPRLERTRMGSKTVVEIQRKEGFDAVVLDVHPGKRMGRVGSRIAEYVQEHATCPVVVVSEWED